MKKILLILAASAGAVLGGCKTSGKPEAARVKFKEFPIGVYSAVVCDSDMKAIRDAGFNMVHTYSSSDKDYDTLLESARRNGLKVMFNLDRKLVTGLDGVEKMRVTVRKYKEHPALGFWYLYDEPAGKITPDVLRPFYKMLKEETPDIPVALVNCWDETWDRYSDVLDIQMVDLYPVRDQKFPEAPIQQFTTLVKEAVALGKPVMAVPQLMSWKSFSHQLKGYQAELFRYPNVAELRYMMFGSMTYGVCGFFGYSYHHAMRTGGDSGWWSRDCGKVFMEVRDFAAAVKEPSEPVIFRRAGDSNQRAAYWPGKDGGFLVLVNAWPLENPRPGCWLEGYFDKDYELIPWGNTRKVTASIINNRIKIDGKAQPWEVFIWKMKEKERK